MKLHQKYLLGLVGGVAAFAAGIWCLDALPRKGGRAIAAPVEAPGPKNLKPAASPPSPDLWPIGSEKLREETTKQFTARIYALHNTFGPALEHELDSIAFGLGALAAIVDSKPIPSVSMNISPPLTRADGTRYSSQGVFSGMNPESIQDPEQRQAYRDKLARQSELSRQRTWLLQARTDHRTLLRNLEEMLKALVAGGTLSQEKADAVLAVAKRNPTAKNAAH